MSELVMACVVSQYADGTVTVLELDPASVRGELLTEYDPPDLYGSVRAARHTLSLGADVTGARSTGPGQHL